MGRIDGGCNATNIVYQVDVKGAKSQMMTYYGQTMRPFKKRWIEHKNAIENETSPHATALSNYIHKLKKAKEEYAIKCSIKNRSTIYSSGGEDACCALKKR